MCRQLEVLCQKSRAFIVRVGMCSLLSVLQGEGLVCPPCSCMFCIYSFCQASSYLCGNNKSSSSWQETKSSNPELSVRVFVEFKQQNNSSIRDGCILRKNKTKPTKSQYFVLEQVTSLKQVKLFFQLMAEGLLCFRWVLVLALLKRFGEVTDQIIESSKLEKTFKIIPCCTLCN